MFLLLTQVLLWLLITFLLYQLLVKIIPKAYFTLLGGLLVFAIIVLAFFFPNDEVVAAAWRVLSFPLRPVGAAILLLIVALNKGVERNYVVAALLVLLISSTPIVANLLAQRLEPVTLTPAEQVAVETPPATPPVTPVAGQNVGAIVVLGRDTTRPTILPNQTQLRLTESGDRILYAAQLYQAAGNQPLVIVSPGSRVNGAGVPDQTVEANDIATLLAQAGVPRDRIVVEPTGADLRSSALAVRRILEERGLSDAPVAVVTSGFNSRRARLTFADLGLNVVSRPVDFVGFQTAVFPRVDLGDLRIESFIPNVEALTVTTRVVEEFLSSVYYYLRGWT
jgi:uncharacterized SAM-binding protein YcdF (DUF218 family)